MHKQSLIITPCLVPRTTTISIESNQSKSIQRKRETRLISHRLKGAKQQGERYRQRLAISTPRHTTLLPQQRFHSLLHPSLAYHSPHPSPPLIQPSPTPSPIFPHPHPPSQSPLSQHKPPRQCTSHASRSSLVGTEGVNAPSVLVSMSLKSQLVL